MAAPLLALSTAMLYVYRRFGKEAFLFLLKEMESEIAVLFIERDGGELFDLTDPDLPIKGISGFMLSGLMEAQRDKAYLVTTGYNRNILRFPRNRKEGEEAHPDHFDFRKTIDSNKDALPTDEKPEK